MTLGVLPHALSRRPATGTPLTSNQHSAAEPFQRWYNFKEAFAPQFVADIVGALPQRPTRCLDPFGGSGTTAVACQFLGIEPSIIEVNPFLADLAEAKLTNYAVDALTVARGELADFLSIQPTSELPTDAFADAPPTFVEPGVKGRWIFDLEVAQRIWHYRRFIDAMTNQDNARLFRVLLGAALVPVSNVTISGKGRRYRRNWNERRSDPLMLDQLFEAGYSHALYDICRYRNRECFHYQLLRGDARQLVGEAGDIELVITSPPYPNSFDYTDIYNVELWALGYLGSKADNRFLREATLRSHIQIKRAFEKPRATSAALESTLDALAEVQDRLWDRDIPAMVSSYFADLETVLCGVRKTLVQDGTAALVVGDSRYAKVHIDVAGILTEIAEQSGFGVVDRYPVRSMRSSPQHGGSLELTEWLVKLVPA